MGGMGLINPRQVAAVEYVALPNITSPLAQQIESQAPEPTDENEIRPV